MQNKNLKLKLGLCGLALTSFLALNTHSIVHADTLDGSNANNNAITWDSDNDDSQVVKQEPEQAKASPTVQAQATVQSNVQVRQTQPVQNKKVMVSSVSSAPSSQSVQNRAEKSNLRQSNTDVRAVNRLSADNQVNVKVANVDATVSNEPVSITNPAGDVVKVHYVDSNGKAVSGINDASINVSKSGTGKYTVPNGYQLVNPNGTYTITSNKHVVHHPAETHVVHHDATGHYEEVQTGYGWSNSGADNESGSMTEDEYNQFINEHGGDSATGISGDTTTTVSPTYSDEWVEDSPAYDETVVDRNAWDETVGDDTFTDKSGNVKSATGNVVNLVVVKPQSVNDASQTRKSAERVIYVNLPDDQAARDRYKGILNSNSQIVQTVNFTRSITQDALTGNVLSETNWQGPSSFPAVTLPDIPGYTMTMN